MKMRSATGHVRDIDSNPPLTVCRFLRLHLLAWSVAVPGCRLMGSDDPVPGALVACRQLSQQGMSALDRHDLAQAEMFFSRAVAACPVDPEARRQYAEALWQRGNVGEAVGQLDEARRLTGDEPKLLVRAAEMRSAMGQLDESKALAERAIDLDPKDPAALAIRGRVRRQSGQLREALADYHRALRYAPNDREVLLDAAEVYRELGQPQRALTSLQSLADTYPPGEEPQNVLYLMGLAYGATSRYRDAAEVLAAARDRGPPSPELLCRLAEAEMRSGQTATARRTAQQALLLEPNYSAALALLDRIDLAQGNGGLAR
jgi:tetratricopeptide (TPR) repeat protein